MNGFAEALENVLGTAIAIALVMVGRVLSKKYEKLIDDGEGDDHASGTGK